MLFVGEPREPGLHPIPCTALYKPLPLGASPRLGRHQGFSAGFHFVGGTEFTAPEQLDRCNVFERSLVLDRERG